MQRSVDSVWRNEDGPHRAVERGGWIVRPPATLRGLQITEEESVSKTTCSHSRGPTTETVIVAQSCALVLTPSQSGSTVAAAQDLGEYPSEYPMSGRVPWRVPGRRWQGWPAGKPDAGRHRLRRRFELGLGSVHPDSPNPDRTLKCSRASTPTSTPQNGRVRGEYP